MRTPDLTEIIAQLGENSRFAKHLHFVATTGSTNTDLLADLDAADSTVLIAGHQTAGKGRFDRRWENTPGASVAVSVLLEPNREPSHWGWLSLLTGVAIKNGVAELGDGKVELKWPNDVLLNGKKICGILCQTSGAKVVCGFGINVTEAPPAYPNATSLADHGFSCDQARLIANVLRHFERLYGLWDAGADVRGLYESSCNTLGKPVRILVDQNDPTKAVEGLAVGVDEFGALKLANDAGEVQQFCAGDVIHLRPQP